MKRQNLSQVGKTSRIWVSEGVRETYSMPLKLSDLEFRGWDVHGKENRGTYYYNLM